MINFPGGNRRQILFKYCANIFSGNEPPQAQGDPLIALFLPAEESTEVESLLVFSDQVAWAEIKISGWWTEECVARLLAILKSMRSEIGNAATREWLRSRWKIDRDQAEIILLCASAEEQPK